MKALKLKLNYMKKALFFDLDGTLWDALVPLTESRNKAMEEHNLSYRFDLALMKSFMGLTPLETVEKEFNDVNPELGMEYFKICLNAEIVYLSKHPGKLYPDEEEVLELLSKSYPLYVVSNADKGYIENYLYAAKMGKYFSGHLCAGDTNLDKNKNIRILMERENIDEVIYIGDTLKDCIESEKAGVKFIHAAYGFGEINKDCYKINSLRELPELVNKIFNNKF